jgi:D-lyxose ketol-isomerase
MKRSEVNAIMREADGFFAKQGFHLPPFAHWSPAEWSKKGPEVAEIVDRRLGWDITDFGRNDFCSCGITLFTIRNGPPEDLARGKGKLYCEKILMFRRDQRCPYHFHWLKMEDIINRGGGELVVQVCDAGTGLRLQPGESASMPPYTYHQITGRHDRVMVGEVSLVNDDDRDNRFLEKVGRFPDIEEDEPPLFLLRQDYARYYPLFDPARRR